MSTAVEVIGQLIPSKVEGRRIELATSIVNALTEAGHIHEEISAVEVLGARVPVETVEVYGLTITLDANGNAVQISSPWGLEVAE